MDGSKVGRKQDDVDLKRGKTPSDLATGKVGATEMNKTEVMLYLWVGRD